MQLIDKKHKLLRHKSNSADWEKQLVTALDSTKPIDHLDAAREILIALRELNDENAYLIRMLSNGYETGTYDSSGIEHRVDRFFSEFARLHRVLDLFLTHCFSTDSDTRDTQ